MWISGIFLRSQETIFLVMYLYPRINLMTSGAYLKHRLGLESDGDMEVNKWTSELHQIRGKSKAGADGSRHCIIWRLANFWNWNLPSFFSGKIIAWKFLYAPYESTYFLFVSLSPQSPTAGEKRAVGTGSATTTSLVCNTRAHAPSVLKKVFSTSFKLRSFRDCCYKTGRVC